MRQRLLLVPIILIILIGFFILSDINYAFSQEASWPLKKSAVESILDITRKEPLSKTNLNLFSESVKGYDINAPRKTGAVVLVKQAILKKQLDYWFKEKPKELSKKFLKTLLKVGITIATKGSYGAYEVLNGIEKYSVKKANEYAMKWLLQNEIKVGVGRADYSYQSYKKNPQTITISYVILYKPINKKYGEILIEFYSKDAIEPPKGTGGLGGVDYPSSNPWPWDLWLENEQKRDNDGKLEPFIVRVKGYVKKGSWNTFNWDKSKEEPTVEIEFDKPVPQIEKSDILLEQGEAGIKENFIKKKILKPTISKVGAFFNGVKNTFNALKSKIFGIKNKTINLIRKIKSYLLGVNPKAEIIIKTSSQLEENHKGNKENSNPSASKEGDNKEGKTFSQKSSSGKSAQPTGIKTKTAPKGSAQNLQNKKPKEGATFKEKSEDSGLNENFDTENKKLSTPKPSQGEEKALCSTANPQSPLRNKVIFNEIAWMGTSVSANDEWIELKNISDSDISLSGWQIFDKDKKIKIIFGDNVALGKNKYLLLERTNDDSVPNIQADLIYTGSLNNTNETLYFYDNNCQLQDIVKTTPDWPGGNSSTKQTMERKWDLSWQTSQFPEGTPKSENSPGETIRSAANGGGGSSSGAPPSSNQEKPNIDVSLLPKILITEIQVESEKGANDEFIELYNPNDFDVSLEDWSIQKATKSGSIYKKNFGPGNVIKSKGYFLVANKYASSEILNLSDMQHSSFSISSNNTIFLVKNQKYLISGQEKSISDKVGYGESFSPEGNSAKAPGKGQSIGRKFLQQSANYQDTDNNASDFEINSPTPKAKNKNTVNTTTSSTSTATTTNTTSANGQSSTNASSTEGDSNSTSSESATSTQDTFPPSAISDLTATSGPARGEITLSWTAPSDKPDGEKVKEYLIRYYSSKITEQNWASSTSVAASSSTPKAPGGKETLTITNLSDNSYYYFAIKSKDENGNVSEISNSAGAETFFASLDVSPKILNFETSEGKNPPSNFVVLSNKGKIEMGWKSSWKYKWTVLKVSNGKLSGNSSTSIEVQVNSLSLSKGKYQDELTFEGENAKNGIQNVLLNLEIAEKENATPTASFFYSPQSPKTGETVIFNASSSDDTDGKIKLYSWSFDNGNSFIVSDKEEITHTFSKSGKFTVSLTTTDDKGAVSETFSKVVKVKEAPPPPKTVLISEVQLGDNEFVELFNYGSSTVNVSGWYFSYFSSKRDWNNPWRNKKFPENAAVKNGGYYLIGLKGYPDNANSPSSSDWSDWQVYKTAQLSGTAGAVGIFSCNPASTSTEKAAGCKVDAVGWGDAKVKEASSTTPAPNGKSLNRKKDAGGKYIDTDNNSADFEINSLTPTNSYSKLLISSENNASSTATSSAASTTETNKIAKNPQWAMFGLNAQHTFQSPYQGPATSTLKKKVKIEANQITSGGVIDGSGAVYIGTSEGLVSLAADGSKQEWVYKGEKILQHPVIDKEGNVYLISYGKILAISSEGKLKWEKQISTTFSYGSNNYNNVNLVSGDGTLYYPALKTEGTSTKPYLFAIKTNDGSTVWEKPLSESSNTNPASSPIAAADGTVYIGYGDTLFKFKQSSGEIILTKKFSIDESCKNAYPNFVSLLSATDSNRVYFIVRGENYIQNAWCSYCADTLYALAEDGEVEWTKNVGQSSSNILIDNSENVYLRANSIGGISCSASQNFYSFDKKGVLRFSKNINNFTPRLIDKNGNIFGSFSNFSQGVIALNNQGEEIWQYESSYPDYFIYPFSLSKNGSLYCPTSNNIFIFNKE
jgi:hypothetical protein